MYSSLFFQISNEGFKIWFFCVDVLTGCTLYSRLCASGHRPARYGVQPNSRMQNRCVTDMCTICRRTLLDFVVNLRTLKFHCRSFHGPFFYARFCDDATRNLLHNRSFQNCTTRNLVGQGPRKLFLFAPWPLGWQMKSGLPWSTRGGFPATLTLGN